MHIGEQAVQVFTLVTNCLCSDSNISVITQFLRLCDDAVTDTLVHLGHQVFLTVVLYEGSDVVRLWVDLVFMEN